MSYRSLFWLIPFIACAFGYWLTDRIFSIETIAVPRVVGMSIQEGISVISAHKLNVRTLAEKLDPDLAPGTIVQQIPNPGEKIKSHHSVFLVTSKQPLLETAPDLLNKDLTTIQEELQKLEIKPLIFMVPSNLPANTCVCQYPKPSEPLPHKKISLYISNPDSSLVIFPSCVGENLEQVLEFLQFNGIFPTISYGSNTSIGTPHEFVVTDQKPLPGTCIDLAKPPHVQLLVQRI